ncbi:Os08g0264400 [Oryza sativa Japonica Group]|uniref:Os08g0264400 protein n=1 Tax=Oryza sativa subsp. japonica TaxID=39947 RepID=A0A0P0XE40_ORYSJ|nr:Os08g0264400 [Oryza sativa Japonica Group]
MEQRQQHLGGWSMARLSKELEVETLGMRDGGTEAMNGKDKTTNGVDVVQALTNLDNGDVVAAMSWQRDARRRWHIS